jgi:TRAP-type C4-dicarboxylate transport system substrate-binding protein
VVPLAWGENGYRELTNSKRPIKSPADLKGMKIRVVGSPSSSDTFTALGANPTQMSWADAQPALASGAVDGQENPLFRVHAAKLHTVGQKYVTMWGYVADPLIFVVNKDIWNSWTPALQRGQVVGLGGVAAAALVRQDDLQPLLGDAGGLLLLAQQEGQERPWLISSRTGA